MDLRFSISLPKVHHVLRSSLSHFKPSKTLRGIYTRSRTLRLSQTQKLFSKTTINSSDVYVLQVFKNPCKTSISLPEVHHVLTCPLSLFKPSKTFRGIYTRSGTLRLSYAHILFSKTTINLSYVYVLQVIQKSMQNFRNTDKPFVSLLSLL